MKTMSYKKMFGALAAATMIVMTMTACGNKGEGNTDVETTVNDSGTLPVDAKMTDVAYKETDVEYETAVTETTTTEATTESTTETTESETDDSSSGDSSSGGGGGNAGGSSGSWESDVDLSERNAYANLAWFRVYEDGTGEDYSLRDTRKFEEFTDEHHLNQFGDFMKIEGETYNGYLTEAFGFSGQAYWLRGEGSQKCFIETNDANEITAIAFTNVSSYYGMQFDCVCPYTHCDTDEDVDKFRTSLVDGDKEKPYMYESGDGNGVIMTFNDGKYSLSLEIVYDAGTDGGAALKTVMISTRTHERVQE